MQQLGEFIAIFTAIALFLSYAYFRLGHKEIKGASQASTALQSLGKQVVPVLLPGARVAKDSQLPFPLTLSPNDVHANGDDLVAFVRAHRSEILELVRTSGAVLLRGWRPCSAQNFSSVTAALGLHIPDMSCSAGPRFEVAPDVFTANEAPPTERIPFHHEMAQCDAPPSIVAFYCEVAAPEGGATPILQSHLAAEHLHTHYPQIAEKLRERGVRYVRIMPPVTDPSSALGKSWKNSLRVETAEEAEAALDAMGSTWEWLPGGMLRTETKAVPALIHDERSGREVFFTAAETTFNKIADAKKSSAGGGSDEAGTIRPVKAIIYGDGSPLDDATQHALLDVSEFMIRSQVAIPWQPGDAMLLNNATVQHSRQTFTPPRRILASLVGSLSKEGSLKENLSGQEAATCHHTGKEGGGARGNVSPTSTMDALPMRSAIA